MSDASDRDAYHDLAAGAAAGAGALAIVAAVATRGAPRWVRVTLVLGLLAIACSAGVYAYRLYSRPVTLTVAAGSFDGDAPKLMAAIASELAEAESPVRLKVVEKATAAEAAASFANGETDLAVVRPDGGGLASARSLMVVAHEVVLIVAPPGSAATDFDDLKGKTIGVIGGAINRNVTAILAAEYEFEKNKTRVRDLSFAEAGDAVQAKQVQALLAVMPITEKYLGRLREILLRAPKGKVVVVPIESAAAIASIHKAFESWDLPKGILRGSPPVPEDDATTLRMPVYLVANKRVSDDAAGALVKAVFEARRELVAAHPLLAQITEPDTETDAFIPVHPGAAAYFAGEQKTFFDKYGDQLFYGSMLLGSLASLVAAAWRFMARGDTTPVERPLGRLFALMDDVRDARDEAELAQVETAIDDVLRAQLDDSSSGKIDAGEAAAVGLATHRLEHMLGRKRAALATEAPTPPAKVRQA